MRQRKSGSRIMRTEDDEEEERGGNEADEE